MKLHKLLCFLFVSIVACQADHNTDLIPTDLIQKNIYSNISLEQTEAHLIETFLQDFDKKRSAFTITNYIQKLDSISQTQTGFVTLKPANYQPVSSVNATSFLTYQQTTYDQLNVSITVKNYLDALLMTSTERSISLLINQIHTDGLLSTNERQMLVYIANTASVVYKNGKPYVYKPDWDKRKICGIAEGWNISIANAVFNAALADLYSIQ